MKPRRRPRLAVVLPLRAPSRPTGESSDVRASLLRSQGGRCQCGGPCDVVRDVGGVLELVCAACALAKDAEDRAKRQRLREAERSVARATAVRAKKRHRRAPDPDAVRDVFVEFDLIVKVPRPRRAKPKKKRSRR